MRTLPIVVHPIRSSQLAVHGGRPDVADWTALPGSTACSESPGGCLRCRPQDSAVVPDQGRSRDLLRLLHEKRGEEDAVSTWPTLSSADGSRILNADLALLQTSTSPVLAAKALAQL